MEAPSVDELKAERSIENLFLQENQEGGCKSCTTGIVFSKQIEDLNRFKRGTAPNTYFDVPYEAADKLCSDLNAVRYNGFSDWRLPTASDVDIPGGLKKAWTGSGDVSRSETRFYTKDVNAPAGQPQLSRQTFKFDDSSGVGYGFRAGPANGTRSPRQNILAICVRSGSRSCQNENLKKASIEGFIKGTLVLEDGQYFVYPTYGNPLPANASAFSIRDTFLSFSDPENGATKKFIGPLATEANQSGKFKLWLDVGSSAAVQTRAGLIPINSALTKRVLIRGKVNFYERKISDYPQFIRLIPQVANQDGLANCKSEKDDGFQTGFDGCEDRRTGVVKHRFAWIVTPRTPFLVNSATRKSDGVALQISNEQSTKAAADFCTSQRTTQAPDWRMATSQELESNVRNNEVLDGIQPTGGLQPATGLYPTYILSSTDYGGPFNRELVGTLVASKKFSEKGNGKIGSGFTGPGGSRATNIIIPNSATFGNFAPINQPFSGASGPFSIYNENFGEDKTSYACVRPISAPYVRAFTPPLPGFKILYRSFNPVNQKHFFTSNYAEYESVKQNLRFVQEGEAFTMKEINFPGGVPVLRLYNKQADTHYYTTNEAEKNHLIGLRDSITNSNPWVFEGQQGFIYGAPHSSAGPEIFKLYNRQTGAHLYTTILSEKVRLLRAPTTWEINTSMGYAAGPR